MVIGQLDRRIQIGSYTTAKNLSGEDIQTWTYATAIWANVQPVGGGESTEGDQNVGESVNIFTIRYRTGVEQKNRIKYNSKDYDILSVDEIERKKYLQIKARRKDNE